ncbi:Auxin efflux carrier [Rhypophila sp. PSN 637]
MGFLTFRSPTSGRLADSDIWNPTPGQLILINQEHSHPPTANIMWLVFGAVLEVVCVALPGYVIARLGHFDADKQKFLANLNVMLFTPCLIFIKLASQLDAKGLKELGIIPVIFVIQTLVSYLVSTIVARCFGFNKRASNFVTAMGVFGNSNSLPISLVLSLSQTIDGLHWDQKPNDDDNSVGARGILYLMIFQQLGQLVRWSWGYHVLLAPKDKYEEYNDHAAEEGRYLGQHEDEADALLSRVDTNDADEGSRAPSQSDDLEHYEPAGRTPVAGSSTSSPDESDDEEQDNLKKHQPAAKQPPVAVVGQVEEYDHTENPDGIMSFPRIGNTDEAEIPSGVEGLRMRNKLFFQRLEVRASTWLSRTRQRVFDALPTPIQTLLSALYRVSARLAHGVWEFMNPPLWAMLIALTVALVPRLNSEFFPKDKDGKDGKTFISSSVTSAIQSSAGVAVPLILVVLGANLARNTQKRDDSDPEEKEIGTKLLVASLISRMLLPTLIMTPILAIIARYVPVSILADPIFIIVCFLLTGAPSALQLAQICQINNVYETVMGSILFQSYVVWILPSTLGLVMAALEVLEWVKASKA